MYNEEKIKAAAKRAQQAKKQKKLKLKIYNDQLKKAVDMQALLLKFYNEEIKKAAAKRAEDANQQKYYQMLIEKAKAA